MALFYHSGIFLSIASDDFIVCMFVYLFGSGASVAAVSSARVRRCGSVAAVSPAYVRRCGSVGAVSLARVRRCGSIAASCLGSRLSFFLCQEKRDGLRYLAFLFRRVEIAIRAFSQRSSVICFGGFTSGLAVYLWRSRRGYRGHEERGTGERGWRRGLCALLHGRVGFAALSAGVRWGCAPQTAPKSLRLSGLSSRCGGAWLVRIRAFVTPESRALPSSA